MIIDTSVLAAVLFREEETEDFLNLLGITPSLEISAGNWVELTTVLARRGRGDLLAQAEQLRANFTISVAPVTQTQAEIARGAYLEFGKGSRHPAKLNFGDCFAYALAKETGAPLLFKGDDFIHTDITPAL